MKMKQNFVQDQKVMVRRLGDDGEYRAKVVGVMAEFVEVNFYIVEMIDQLPGLTWTHACMPEGCMDPENWIE